MHTGTIPWRSEIRVWADLCDLTTRGRVHALSHHAKGGLTHLVSLLGWIQASVFVLSHSLKIHLEFAEHFHQASGRSISETQNSHYLDTVKKLPELAFEGINVWSPTCTKEQVVIANIGLADDQIAVDRTS